MDLINLFQYLAALALVLALLVGLAWVVRRAGFAQVTRPARGKRRLEVLEVLPLDPKRRLMLVRCDTEAHLLLLGQDGDLVIQRGIAHPRFELPSADASALKPLDKQSDKPAEAEVSP